MALDVLVVDDEADIRELVAGVLEDEGYSVRTAADSSGALDAIEDRRPSLVLLDVWLQGSRLDGLQLLEQVKARDPTLPVIMISGHGNLDTAVAAIREGAVDFIEKPFEAGKLLHLVGRATETDRLRRENAAFRQQFGQDDHLGGSSVAINTVRATLKRVAPTGSRVLITGPAGVGKEIAARMIHNWSPRVSAPFITVSAAMMSPERVEEELFGSEAAGVARPGLLEQAHGGTLFLDEIADMPLTTQAKMLRVLTDQSYTRVGGQRPVKVDVRVLSATSRDLAEEIAAGRFREDLYYRLDVFPVRVSPLRDRREDIPMLAKYFVELLAKEMKCTKPRLTEAGVIRLQEYHWPGNIRELRNVIERATILARGKVLEFDLPTTTAEAPALPAPRSMNQEKAEPEFMTEPEIQRRERENLRIVLNKTGWKVGGPSGAAELLGVKPTTLISRIKKMGLSRNEATQ